MRPRLSPGVPLLVRRTWPTLGFAMAPVKIDLGGGKGSGRPRATDLAMLCTPADHPFGKVHNIPAQIQDCAEPLEGMSEGTIVKWFKQVGDRVEQEMLVIPATASSLFLEDS